MFDIIVFSSCCDLTVRSGSEHIQTQPAFSFINTPFYKILVSRDPSFGVVLVPVAR